MTINEQEPWINELYQWADDNNIPELQYIEDTWDAENELLLAHSFWVGLPRDREVLVNLEELNLSWHNCTEIPEQIRHLKNLKKFTFCKRKYGLQPPFHENSNGLGVIEEIPDWIAELENLEELNLSHNKIKYVSNAIGKLKNLKKLYLHDNAIMFVDGELASLCKLEVLWISPYISKALDRCIDKMKEVVNPDFDWQQQNKLALVIDWIRLGDLEELIERPYFGLMLEDFESIVCGRKHLIRQTGSNDIEILWNELKRQTTLKYQLNNLKNLRELFCSGLDYPDGPIRLCPEGLIVEDNSILKGEDCVDFLLENTSASFIKSGALDVLIELKEHHGKSLIEKIDFLDLWK